jgi:hypothetical protein
MSVTGKLHGNTVIEIEDAPIYSLRSNEHGHSQQSEWIEKPFGNNASGTHCNAAGIFE